MNLRPEMQRLPAGALEVLGAAGRLAADRGLRLYLVGGVVRDLLMGHGGRDLDLVVQGDALPLARELSEQISGRVVTHGRFGTATVRARGFRLDFVTARSETYGRPGALPSVKPGNLRDDLFRRDFTINAMAVDVSPWGWGTLIDHHGGLEDLKGRRVRVLHGRSFTDDATRIWRAVRYEQRLGFTIEPGTLRLLRRDVRLLDTISGDRLRHELELALQEEHPERVLRRAAALGILGQVHPSLKWSGWLALKFARARALGLPDRDIQALYFALIAYCLSPGDAGQVLERLNAPRAVRGLVGDTLRVRARLTGLHGPGPGAGELYRRLGVPHLLAVRANAVAGPPAVRWCLEMFLRRLPGAAPLLSGEDVMSLGVARGPDVGRVLERLREARLDCEVATKAGEERLVRGWVSSSRASL